MTKKGKRRLFYVCTLDESKDSTFRRSSPSHITARSEVDGVLHDYPGHSLEAAGGGQGALEMFLLTNSFLL